MKKFSLAFLFFVSSAIFAGDAVELAKEPGKVPEKLQAVMAALPAEARPQEMTLSKNGAIYALLPNGLEIIVKEKHSAPVVTVQAWVRTGAVDENKWLGAGLSHFCEHMLFKGTTKRQTGVLDQEIRGAGGDDNAYTTAERTVYHITTAADGFDTSFGVLADMVMDSTFPPEETVKEHKVVYKEIERFLDNPDGVLFETFERMLYQVHPYRVPVLGYPERFQEVTRDDVFAYYQQRYSPQMCTFITVGDFDPLQVMPKMALALSVWKRKSVAPVAVPEEPEQIAPRYVQVTHPLCQAPKIVMGFPTVPLRHPDLYALDVLASILGDGRSSRLYHSLKDEHNLALEVGAFDNTPMYMGYLAINAVVESANLDAARTAILRVIEDARNKAPSADELARAKRKVYTQHIFAQMTPDGLAETLGNDWLVAGDLDFSGDYSERIQQVTAEDVLRVAKEYLVPEKLNTAVLLPPSEAKAAVEAVAKKEDDQAALNAELKKLEADPAVAKASLLANKAVFEFTLKPSGVRVVVREDHSLSVVNIALASLGGTRWEGAALAGAGNLLAQMLDRGTGTRSKLKIASDAEDLGATLATFSGKNSFGVSISGLKQDLPKLMDLVGDTMLHPNFPKDEFDKLKDDTLQEIMQQDESLSVLNGKILRPLLYEGHPYARQTLGTTETVKKVTLDDLKKLHGEWVQPENLAVSFVGDVSALEALQFAQQYFGALQPGHFQAPAVPPIPELAEGKTGEGEKADIKGAILTLGFRGVDLKSQNRESLDLIAALLSGLGGRLNVALREKQGLAYDIGVNNDSQLDGGAIVFYIHTDAKSLDKALAGMWEEVNKLRGETVPAKELESVKNYLSGTEAIELQNQADLAQRLALAQLFNEGAAHVFGRRARLDKLTVEDVKAAADKFLDQKHWAKAVLKPK